MSLFWHLVITDLRHARWSLALWSLTQIALVGVSLTLWYAPGFHIRYPALSEPLIGVAGFALVFAAYDFGVRVIQNDNPGISHAFWRTRPIAPLGLLAAKLVTLFGGLALTALPAAVLVFVQRFSDGFSMDSSPQLFPLVIALPFLGLAIVFASFTPSSRSCLIASMSAVLIFFLWAMFNLDRLVDADAGLATARFYATSLVAFATASIAIVYLYRTGRFARSLSILGIGLTAALASPLWWHVPFLSHKTIAPETESALTRDIALRTGRQQYFPASRKSDRSSILVFPELAMLPPGYLPQITSIRQHWDKANITAGLGQSTPADIPAGFARAALTDEVPRFTGSLSYRVTLSAQDAARLKSDDTIFKGSGEITFTLVVPEIAATIPLSNPSQSVIHAYGRSKIAAIDPHGAAFWVSTITEKPLKSDADSALLQLGGPSPRQSVYFLVRRPSGEILRLYNRCTVSAIGTSLTEFPLRTLDQPVRSAQWLAECDLVQVLPRPVARFTRTFDHSR